MVQRHVMETNEGPAQVALPAHFSETFLEGKKTGAALLISGILLVLVGVTFTAMGWQQYKADPDFEVIQLLGPVLISVGGTFVLTSVCKFPMFSCCKNSNEEALVIEPTSPGPSLTFTNTSNPVMIHGTTTMVCLPPSYSFITQEVHRTVGGCVNGVHAGSPPYDTVFCVANAAFTEEEDGIAEHRRRYRKPDEDRVCGDEESGSMSLRPPAYEDIFPSFNKHNPT